MCRVFTKRIIIYCSQCKSTKTFLYFFSIINLPPFQPTKEVIESEHSFSPIEVNQSEFDDKESDVFEERTATDKELSSRQAESSSDRAESTMSRVTLKNNVLSMRGAYENEQGALIREPEFSKTQNAKSREVMQKKNIGKTSNEEAATKSTKTRKKSHEKRLKESHARTRKRKRTRKRAHATTSIVLFERTEQTFEESGRNEESQLRQLESAMSIRVVQDRYGNI